MLDTPRTIEVLASGYRQCALPKAVLSQIKSLLTLYLKRCSKYSDCKFYQQKVFLSLCTFICSPIFSALFPCSIVIILVLVLHSFKTPHQPHPCPNPLPHTHPYPHPHTSPQQTVLISVGFNTFLYLFHYLLSFYLVLLKYCFSFIVGPFFWRF